MKTALVITGEPRAPKPAFKTIKNHILDVVDCDVFMVIPKVDGLSEALDCIDEYGFDCRGILIHADKTLECDLPVVESMRNHKSESEWVWRKGKSYLQRYLRQIYDIYLGFSMAFEYGEYDRLIRCRSDAKVVKPIDDLSKIEDDKLYAQEIIQKPGGRVHVDDLFAFGGSVPMAAYGNRWATLSKLSAFRPETPEEELSLTMKAFDIEVCLCSCIVERYGRPE